MSIGGRILLRMFGRPRGLFGRLGGVIMARANRRHAVWAVGLMEIQPDDRVLEVGSGPGVAVELLAQQACSVTGIDPSWEMLRQANRRNRAAVRQGRVQLRQASAEKLPLVDAVFDKALAINSLQVWPDATAGLRELSRVLKPGGQVALAFTTHSGQSRQGLPELIAAAGFRGCRIIAGDQSFCVLAVNA